MSGKEIKLGKKVLSEDDLKFPVTYDGEVFTLRYPTPYEKSAIEAEIVRRLGGFARNSFPAEHLLLVEATAYVDQLIVSKDSPSWFNAWTCYDEACIEALYTGYLSFRGKFQKQLREG